LPVISSQRRVEAATAGVREARLLKVDRGDPLLVLRSISYTTGSKPSSTSSPSTEAIAVRSKWTSPVQSEARHVSDESRSPRTASSHEWARLRRVDVGTQSVKAAVFELSGACLGEASVPLALNRRAADEVEQEPEDFYRAATVAIASCVAGSGHAGDVACIAVAGQMAGILGIGPDGRAVTPYDSCSTRAAGRRWRRSPRAWATGSSSSQAARRWSPTPPRSLGGAGGAPSSTGW